MLPVPNRRTLLQTFRTHWLFFAVLAIATVVRFVHLRDLTIFIGDQGRDALEALGIVRGESFPLMGIPSSLPRFRQGVFYIYLMAGAMFAGGTSVMSLAMLAASIGVATIVAWYLLLRRVAGIATAHIMTILLALSPMAILHSRMPFVINPVPLTIALYLWQLLRLAERKRYAAVLAGLSFALVYHGELATFPLILLIPYVLWQTHQISKRTILPVAGGIVVGLTPHILYDLTHGFSQLGGFLLWVAYRIVSALVPTTDHSLYNGSLPDALSHIAVLLSRVFTESSDPFAIGMWLSLVAAGTLLLLFSWRRRVMVDRLMVLGTVLLFGAFVIHRAPSEAYVPGILPFLLYMVARLIGSIPWKGAVVIGSLCLGLLIGTTQYLLQSSFFLATDEYAQGVDRRFGAASGVQRQLLLDAKSALASSCFLLTSQEREQTFPTHIDNFIFTAQTLGITQDPGCPVVTIDRAQIANTWQGITPLAQRGSYVIGVTR